MASVGTGDKKFGQLSTEEKLMVTGYLPFDDKIKLMDIFTPVISQIDSFDARNFATKIDDGVKLFPKLINVTKVLLPGRETDMDKALQEAIATSGNSKIRLFTLVGDELSSSYDRCIGEYIRNVRKNDPTYDARHIDYVFSIDNGIKLLNDFHDLKLKLRFSSLLFDSQYLSNENIHDMITMVDSCEDCNVDTDEPLEQFILTSVDHLTYSFDYDYPGTFTITERLNRILKLTPNVSKLTLYLSDDQMSDFEQFKECLLSITNLEHLELLGCGAMTAGQLQDLVSLLLAPRDGNLLTRLKVSFDYVGMDIGSILAMDIKHGIKFLCFEDTKNEYELIVNRNYMLIRNINLPLIDTLNKFPRVKYIDVITKGQKYKRQLYNDIEVVRARLARNKSVTLTVQKKMDE